MNKIEDVVKKNPECIVVEKCEDGNYRATAWKFGKIISVRGVGPQTVIEMILTADGKD